jgi:uncharacterized membrane protein required for colicin V production
MFSNTLSATTWYADVALIAILVLFTLLGMARGFGKSMKGFFMTVTIIFVSLLIMGLLHGTVMESSLGQGLIGSLEGASKGWGVEFNEVIYADEAGTRYLLIDGARQNLAEMGIKGMIANWLAGLFVAEYGVQSLAGLCVYNVTSLIVSAGLFVASCIVISIVCSIIKGMTKGMHNSDSKAVRIVDRVLGGAVGLAVSALFVMVVLAVLKALEGKIPTVVEYINQSTVCKFFYDLNPIGKVLADIFTKH